MTDEGDPGQGSGTARVDTDAAFTAWFRLNFPKLRADLIRAVASYHEAEEAAAAACADLYPRWGQVEHPYVYARTAAIRYLIKKRDRDLQLEQRLAQKGCITEGQEDAGLTIWEDKEWVLGLLRDLPPVQREVMAWIVDRFKPTEIAVLLGRTPAAVRRALSDARRRLKRDLDLQRDGRLGVGRPVPAAMSEGVR